MWLIAWPHFLFTIFFSLGGGGGGGVRKYHQFFLIKREKMYPVGTYLLTLELHWKQLFLVWPRIQILGIFDMARLYCIGEKLRCNGQESHFASLWLI